MHHLKRRWKSITQWQLTGKDCYSAVSNSSGITSIGTSPHTCGDTLGRHSLNINTPIQRYPNTPPIKQQPFNTAQKFRGWKKTNLLPSRRNKSNWSKTLLECSSTTDKQSTPLSPLPSAQSRHNNPMELRLLRKHAINSLIMSQHILTPASATMPVT